MSGSRSCLNPWEAWKRHDEAFKKQFDPIAHELLRERLRAHIAAMEEGKLEDLKEEADTLPLDVIDELERTKTAIEAMWQHVPQDCRDAAKKCQPVIDHGFDNGQPWNQASPYRLDADGVLRRPPQEPRPRRARPRPYDFILKIRAVTDVRFDVMVLGAMFNMEPKLRKLFEVARDNDLVVSAHDMCEVSCSAHGEPQGGVYMLQSPQKQFYMGMSTSIGGRILAHGQPPNPATVNRLERAKCNDPFYGPKPWTSVAVLVVPEWSKAMTHIAECNLITATGATIERLGGLNGTIVDPGFPLFKQSWSPQKSKAQRQENGCLREPSPSPSRVPARPKSSLLEASRRAPLPGLLAPRLALPRQELPRQSSPRPASPGRESPCWTPPRPCSAASPLFRRYLSRQPSPGAPAPRPPPSRQLSLSPPVETEYIDLTVPAVPRPSRPKGVFSGPAAFVADRVPLERARPSRAPVQWADGSAGGPSGQPQDRPVIWPARPPPPSRQVQTLLTDWARTPRPRPEPPAHTSKRKRASTPQAPAKKQRTWIGESAGDSWDNPIILT